MGQKVDRLVAHLDADRIKARLFVIDDSEKSK